MGAKIDIYQSAKKLVEEYGGDASISAAMEADACLERGDLDGKIVWLKVIEVIKAFEDPSGPGPNSVVH